jgi:hypothetical protein
VFTLHEGGWVGEQMTGWEHISPFVLPATKQMTSRVLGTSSSTGGGDGGNPLIFIFDKK